MTRNKLIGFGMFYMLLGAIFFSLMNAFLKVLSNHITINENLFFRGITMTFFVLLLIYIKKRREKTHKHQHKKGGWLKLAFRAFIGTCALYALLYNISSIPLGTSVAFAQSTPIYTAIFAWLFLREKITIAMVGSVIIGFIGVLLISNPETSNLPFINIICGILSGVFTSLAFISIRSLRGYFDDLSIMFSFGLFSMLFGFIAVLVAQDSWSVLNVKDYIFIVLVGIAGTVGQYYITRAYILAPVAIVAPIDYTRIVFSLMFGLVLGDLVPNIFSIIGMLFVILSGILIALPVIFQELNKLKHKDKR